MKKTGEIIAGMVRLDLAVTMRNFYDRPDLATKVENMSDDDIVEMYLHWIHTEADALYAEEEAQPA